jgi:hypothetical protein
MILEKETKEIQVVKRRAIKEISALVGGKRD